ncbi:MAG: hypothetical protein QM581_06520 [Pseudomonas sp.]
MTEETKPTDPWKHWVTQDLWTVGEFAMLCTGLSAKSNLTDEQVIAINRATEAIRRGMLAGTLKFVSHSDATTADRMYDQDRHVRPAEAIAWARERFQALPEELGATTLPAESTQRTENDLRLIGGLLLLGGYDLNKSWASAEALKVALDGVGVSFSPGTLSKRIKAAAKQIQQDTLLTRPEPQ